MTKRVVVLPGDDAAPEAVAPSVALLKGLAPAIEWVELPTGEEGLERYGHEEFARVVREAIDRSDTTLFGASSGKTAGTVHLRWGKDTYANVRPVKWRQGFNSPLRRPEGIDFVIVRENLEDVYVGVERPLGELGALQPRRRRDGVPIDTSVSGAFAVKVITEEGTRRVARFASELARRRREAGGRGKLPYSSTYKAVPGTCRGCLRQVGRGRRDESRDRVYVQFTGDHFARRIVAAPHDLDVVVLPNLYGDILSDEAAGVIGGLGLAPSGCYGDAYAYFESVHGSAPDIAGRHIINPTATILSAVMMLEYLGYQEEARWLDDAVSRVYAEGRHLTPDQGGTASTEEFCQAMHDLLMAG